MVSDEQIGTKRIPRSQRNDEIAVRQFGCRQEYALHSALVWGSHFGLLLTLSKH
jgi:hypothetical protein